MLGVPRHSSNTNNNGLSSLQVFPLRNCCTVKTGYAAVTLHGAFRLDKGILDQTDSVRNSTFNAGSVSVKLIQIDQGAKGFWHKSSQQSYGNIQDLQILQQANFRGQASGKAIFVYDQNGQIRQASDRRGDGTRESKGGVVRGNVGIETQFHQLGKDAHVFWELGGKEIEGKVQVHQLDKVGESRGKSTYKEIILEVQGFQIYQSGQ
jgi:hypothetical protein